MGVSVEVYYCPLCSHCKSKEVLHHATKETVMHQERQSPATKAILLRLNTWGTRSGSSFPTSKIHLTALTSPLKTPPPKPHSYGKWALTVEKVVFKTTKKPNPQPKQKKPNQTTVQGNTIWWKSQPVFSYQADTWHSLLFMSTLITIICTDIHFEIQHKAWAISHTKDP